MGPERGEEVLTLAIMPRHEVRRLRRTLVNSQVRAMKKANREGLAFKYWLRGIKSNRGPQALRKSACEAERDVLRPKYSVLGTQN